MRGVDTLVAEVTVDLKDSLHTADDAALEEKLRRDTQVEIDVQSVGMSHERTCSCTAVQSLQHRGFDLEETATLKCVAQLADDLDASQCVSTSLLTHNQVRVAVTHAAVLGQISERHRQRTQSLRGHLPLGSHHRQLAAARRNYAASNEDEVAHIYVRLPSSQGVLADLSLGKHGLQGRAVTLLQSGKAELAGVTNKHDTTNDGHDILSLLASLEVAPLFTDILERVSTGNLNRVRLNSSLEQAVTLLAANAQLLRNGGGVFRGLLRVSHGYKG